MYYVKVQSRPVSDLKIIKGSIAHEVGMCHYIVYRKHFPILFHTTYFSLGLRYVLHKKPKPHTTRI